MSLAGPAQATQNGTQVVVDANISVIGLSNLFTGRSLLYVVLLAAMSLLCLALAVRQKVQTP